MSKCPKCHEEIESLQVVAWRAVESTLVLERGKPEYEWESSSDDVDSPEFICPECDEVLFKTEQEAVTFLKGGAS